MIKFNKFNISQFMGGINTLARKGQSFIYRSKWDKNYLIMDFVYGDGCLNYCSLLEPATRCN